jgi:bifunctional ADP-heptose synthase (sugar kinase/adenylyltransferase)
VRKNAGVYSHLKETFKNPPYSDYQLAVVIFSDFNYGCLPNDLLSKLINLCTKEKIKIVADSQSSSQVGDISRFVNMDIITPTEREARLSLQDYDSGLVAILEKLRKVSQAKNILLKMGENGVLVNQEKRAFPLFVIRKKLKKNEIP